MTVDLDIGFNSQTKETLFKFTQNKKVEYKFELKLCASDLDNIIKGLTEFKEMLK